MTAHYPLLESSVRDRLAARGIDPEASTTALLLSIREDGVPTKMLRSLSRKTGVTQEHWQAGIPAAVTLTAEESARRRRQ